MVHPYDDDGILPEEHMAILEEACDGEGSHYPRVMVPVAHPMFAGEIQTVLECPECGRRKYKGDQS